MLLCCMPRLLLTSALLKFVMVMVVPRVVAACDGKQAGTACRRAGHSMCEWVQDAGFRSLIMEAQDAGDAHDRLPNN
jgi:hypothetical protein